MEINDVIEKHTKLVLDALTYAHDNKLDIGNKEDVTKILQVLNPDHASEEDVEVFMPILDLANKMIEADVVKRKNIDA